MTGERIGPSAPVEALERLMRERLNPCESYQTAVRRAENELNPDWPRPAGPLRPAAVLVPLVERPTGVTVILTRRSESLRSHSGQVAFPGGRADPGEKPWETALREADEEIGLDPSFVRVVGLGDIFETVTGFSIMPVVGFVRPGFTITPHEQEVAEVFETPFDFLMNPSNHELRHRDFGDGRRRQYYAMTHSDRMIWGVTAWMLRSLYQRLFEDES